ncbi:MAG: inactive serine/threonine-protein kinase VRK3 [Minicystis sp.]
MTTPCIQCQIPLAPGAAFCGKCGSAQPAPEPAIPLDLAIDLGTLRHFEAGTRCLLRFRVENRSARPSPAVALHCAMRGAGPLPPASAPTLAPGEAVLLTAFLVPSLGGFDELSGALLLGAPDAQRSYRFEGFQLRIGSSAAPQVQVINIDQRSARVVDNSRSQFGQAQPAGGALLEGEGEWHSLSLTADPAPAQEVERDLVEPTAPLAPVDFEISTEQGSYHLTTTVARGDLATVYGGIHRSTGRDIVLKLADDAADNDLVQTERRVLSLLTSTPSPQQKHLPVVLDQVESGDGRQGTVFERFDGLDLCTLRERLPEGLPERHLIWILRRTLSVLGLAHARGILHGNIEPAHIVVRPRDHNVWLCDWCWAIVEPKRTGQTFRCLNEDYSPPEARERKPPLPSSDLYSLGKTMIYAAGGDPVEKTLPVSMDERVQRFLKFFAYESPLGRPQDAWDMYKQVDNLRKEVFGTHEFVELIV